MRALTAGNKTGCGISKPMNNNALLLSSKVIKNEFEG